MPQPTTNNLEEWEEKFRKLAVKHQFDAKPFALTALQFIKDIRKQDEEELIKMLPDKDNLYVEGCSLKSGYKKEVEKLIKDYYNK